MKNNYKIGQKVILSRECSCLAGTTFEKGDVVTIADIDEIRGYGFVNDKGERIIECGWDCIERAAEDTSEKSNSYTEEELEKAKKIAIEVFEQSVFATGIERALALNFDDEEVEFIIKGIKGAFVTGFDCCSSYVLNKK